MGLLCRMRKWSAPQYLIFCCEYNCISLWACCVGCGNGLLRKKYFFYVKIIVYQSGSVVSDAEMVRSAISICFKVNVIVYHCGSVVSDAEMVRSAKNNSFM